MRATDGAGNLTETSRSFAIDATPPDTSLTSGPSAGRRGGRAHGVVRLRRDGGRVHVRVPVVPSGTTGPPFTPCSGAATHTASGLADGSYRFEVRGIDAVGNTDASPATRDFTVDATPPAARFAEVPKRTVKTPKKKAKVAFTFTSEAGATFRCSLDGAAYAPCSASLTLKVKAGKPTLSVVAVDSAGNTSTPATRSWKVKRIPPHR